MNTELVTVWNGADGWVGCQSEFGRGGLLPPRPTNGEPGAADRGEPASPRRHRLIAEAATPVRVRDAARRQARLVEQAAREASRDAIRAMRAEGVSIKQIAFHFGIPEGTVGNAIYERKK